MTNGTETAAGWRPGNIAETLVNPLPRDRTRAGLHQQGGYHIVDFLVMRANS